MCAECHSTGVRKNYDAANDRFASTRAEISLGCETCHGRILLVMATGTGKTYTAFQILWRLWKAGRKKRILYLARPASKRRDGASPLVTFKPRSVGAFSVATSIHLSAPARRCEVRRAGTCHDLPGGRP
jgi:hypothetical protein